MKILSSLNKKNNKKVKIAQTGSGTKPAKPARTEFCNFTTCQFLQFYNLPVSRNKLRVLTRPGFEPQTHRYSVDPRVNKKALFW